MSIRSNTTPRKVLFHSTSSPLSSSSPPPSPSSSRDMKSYKNKRTFVLNYVLIGCMVAYSTYKFGESSTTVREENSAVPANNRNLLRSSSGLGNKLDKTLPKGTGYGHHVSLDLVIPPSEEAESLLIHPTKLQTLTHDWCQQAHLEIASDNEKVQFFPNSQGILYMTTFQNDDGYLTLQTYPTSSKIMMDLLVRGDPERSINLKTELLPLVVQTYHGDVTKSIYSIKQRGISGEEQEEQDKKSSKVTQFHPREIMATHQFKSLVFETQSPYQHIAIYDHHDFAEESQDVVTTTRSLFLDGVMQSNVDDEEKYHETLVHPAMLTAHYAQHEPKRVLIVGGGEGGTLRETLKYKSVETTTMVDLDKGVVDASRQYLPSYNNCTGFGAAQQQQQQQQQQGSELQNCFDDPRTELYTEDFIGWFDKHVGNDICDQRQKGTFEESKLYDVVILDLLDTEELPEDQEWAQHLYSDLFFQRLACVMSPQGVLVTQFGEGPAFNGGPDTDVDKLTKEENEQNQMFVKKIKTIQTQANLFEHTKVYDNFIPAFRAPWVFAVSMIPNVLVSPQENGNLKTMATAALNNFHSSAAYINAKLKRVLRPGADTEYYEGLGQFSFQVPNADWTSFYCMDKDTQQLCAEIAKFFKELKVEQYFAEEQDDVGSKWIAKQTIPKGHITILLPSETQQERDIDGILNKFDCSSDGEGESINMIHASQAKPWSPQIWEDAWNPVHIDHEEEFQHTYVATRDIQKGETILSKEWCLPQVKKTKKVQPKKTDTMVVDTA